MKLISDKKLVKIPIKDNGEVLVCVKDFVSGIVVAPPEYIKKQGNKFVVQASTVRIGVAKKLSSAQLHRLKEQIKGQLIMAEENNSNFMQMMGKSYLDFGKIDSFEQIIKKIDGISSDVIIDLANQLMNPARMSKFPAWFDVTKGATHGATPP